MSDLNTASARVSELRTKTEKLAAEIGELGDKPELTDGQAERLENLMVAHARANAEYLEARHAQVAAIQRGVDAGTTIAVSGDGNRNAPRLSGDSLRSQALRTIDKLERAPEAGRHALASAIDNAAALEDPTEMDALARWTVVASSDDYASAFNKLMVDPQGHREFTGPELDAYQRAQKLSRAMAIGTAATGGVLVPTHLDSAIITSSGNSPKNPILEYCSKAIIATNQWNGVSAGLVNASWDAEAEEVTDDTPTFSAVPIPTGRLTAFLPVSIEAAADTSIGEQVGGLFADAFDYLIGHAFTVGDGSNGSPTGIVTALEGGGQEISQAAGEAITRADAFNLQTGLQPRWRSDAKFMMSLPYLNLFRQLPLLASGTEVSIVDDSGNLPKLLNWDVVVNDHMDSSVPNAAATADNLCVVVGSFKHYQAVFRVGTTVERIEHLFGDTYGRPTGQRGFWAHSRVGGAPTVESAFVLLNVATTA